MNISSMEDRDRNLALAITRMADRMLYNDGNEHFYLAAESVSKAAEDLGIDDADAWMKRMFGSRCRLFDGAKGKMFLLEKETVSELSVSFVHGNMPMAVHTNEVESFSFKGDFLFFGSKENAELFRRRLCRILAGWTRYYPSAEGRIAVSEFMGLLKAYQMECPQNALSYVLDKLKLNWIDSILNGNPTARLMIPKRIIAEGNNEEALNVQEVAEYTTVHAVNRVYERFGIPMLGIPEGFRNDVFSGLVYDTSYGSATHVGDNLYFLGNADAGHHDSGFCVLVGWRQFDDIRVLKVSWASMRDFTFLNELLNAGYRLDLEQEHLLVLYMRRAMQMHPVWQRDKTGYRCVTNDGTELRLNP